MPNKRPGVTVDVGDPVEAEIPADILASLEGERRVVHHNAYIFEPWQDAVILKYWGRYGETGVTQESVCKVLGSRGKRAPSTNTVRSRYETLMEEKRS